MKIRPEFEPGKRIILCIGAHPDDSEFRCGGTIARWSMMGDKIILLSLTDGSSGTYTQSADEIRIRRRLEAQKAASIINAESMNLGIIDGFLEPSLENRLALIHLIRKIEPDIILTNRPNDYHPDHRYTAQLVQDASYMLQVPNVASETPVMRYVPVIMYWGDMFMKPYEFSPKAIVPIDSVLDTKIKMLRCHESQMFEWLPWVGNLPGTLPSASAEESEKLNWVLHLYKLRAIPTYADRFRDLLIEKYGEIGRNVVEAEAFEKCEYGYNVKETELEVIFSKL